MESCRDVNSPPHVVMRRLIDIPESHSKLLNHIRSCKSCHSGRVHYTDVLDTSLQGNKDENLFSMDERFHEVDGFYVLEGSESNNNGRDLKSKIQNEASAAFQRLNIDKFSWSFHSHQTTKSDLTMESDDDPIESRSAVTPNCEELQTSHNTNQDKLWDNVQDQVHDMKGKFHSAICNLKIRKTATLKSEEYNSSHKRADRGKSVNGGMISIFRKEKKVKLRSRRHSYA